MRKTLLALVGLGAVLAAARMLSHEPRTAGSLRDQRGLMGTVWQIEVVHDGRVEAARMAIDQTYKELNRIETVMSEWRPDSPISAVNNAAGKSLVEVPAELRAMLERSIAFSKASDGLFDVTWRGMRHIWRFDDGFRIPNRADVDKARALVNYRDILIQGNRVGLARLGMSIGLGGIAKGYAIDRAAASLAAAGFANFMIDGGGDVLVKGMKAGRPWRLGIQDPRQPRGTLLGSVAMTDGVLVTSGDYERFRMAGGKRYHHIIDPRTGWPGDRCQSVTVIAPNAEQAVVLAKVVFLLGPEKGLALSESQGVPAMVIDVQGKRRWNKQFEPRFVPTE